MTADRNCWSTPADLFARLHTMYDFTVDACALPWNAKLPRYWSDPNGHLSPRDTSFLFEYGPFWEALDGLAQDWTGERVWCNPPYGRGLIEPWVQKAMEGRAELSVLLLPSRTDTAWFQDLLEESFRARNSVVEIIFLPKRVRFVPPPGIKASSPTEASIVVVIR